MFMLLAPFASSKLVVDIWNFDWIYDLPIRFHATIIVTRSRPWDLA
jgi:hypothetical protein